MRRRSSGNNSITVCFLLTSVSRMDLEHNMSLKSFVTQLQNDIDSVLWVVS